MQSTRITPAAAVAMIRERAETASPERIKTPDKIKKGLASCSADECHGDHADCPYIGDIMCIRNICGDAFAYIQQLERERDALLDALKKADVYGDCENCKYRDSAPADCDCECGSCKRNCRCRECRYGDKWEWRGVKEDDK